MKANDISQLFAERINNVHHGQAEAIDDFNREWAALKQEVPAAEWIDMSAGEPDEMADLRIVNKLTEEAVKPENRRCAYNGILDFKQAAAAYLQDVFGVSGMDADTEINHSIGSKSGLALLPHCFINPGDVTIMTVPGYPVLGMHTQYAGGEVYNVKLTAENDYLPDLETIPADIRRRAKLLYLNYPNNPTGAAADARFFAEVVQFARENEIVVVHDASYAALVFDDAQPLSFLSVPGAKEVGVELHSLSKAYNMSGWRIGFIAGNAQIVQAFAKLKQNSDAGQFIAIQKAAAFALRHPEITEKIAEKYSRRHDMLVDALQSLGFKAQKPRSTFFLYVEAPRGARGGPRFETAVDFCRYLLREQHILAMPWDDVGRYVRFSVTFEADGIDEEIDFINQMKQRLATVDFEF